MKPTAAFDVGLPLIQLAAAASRYARASQRRRRALLAQFAGDRGRAGPLGLGRGVVTGPVSKEQLYAIGFSHPGQTEFVAERCGVAADQCRDDACRPDAAHGAGHHPSAAGVAAGALTTALIESRGRAALRGLQRNFGIEDPRLAVAALNPHAGEGGTLGREEIEIIEPAVAALVAEGWRVTGPHPADTMFHTSARAQI